MKEDNKNITPDNSDKVSKDSFEKVRFLSPHFQLQ